VSRAVSRAGSPAGSRGDARKTNRGARHAVRVVSRVVSRAALLAGLLATVLAIPLGLAACSAAPDGSPPAPVGAEHGGQSRAAQPAPAASPSAASPTSASRSSSAPAAAATEPARELSPATPLERRLAGGGAHRYRLVLPADAFVAVSAEQRDLDVVVELFDPRGGSLIAVDSPTGPRGEERLTAVSATAGEHRLEVRAWAGAANGEAAAPGSYVLRLDAVRPASAADRRRAEADRLFADAEGLRRRDDAASNRRAVERYAEALRAAEALGDRQRQAHVYQRLAWVHRKNLDEKRRAVPYFQRAIALFAELGDVWMEASTTNNLGRVYTDLGEMDEAFAATRRALDLWRRAGDRREEAAALNNLAVLYLTQGRVQDALSFYAQALDRLRELDDPAKETRVLHNRGLFFRALGKPQEALDDLDRALELARQLDDRASQAAALTALGQVHEERGELDEAERALRQALALRRALGQERGVARALRGLASVEAGLGQRERAGADLAQALALFRGLDAPRDEAAVRTQLGWLAVAAERPAEALAHLRPARALFAGLDDPAGEASSLLAMARAERNLGDLEAARRDAEEGLRRIESFRGAAAGQSLRSAYFARHQDHYDFLLDLLMELHRAEPAAGYDRRALAVSERSRARSLLDALAAAGVDLRRGVDPVLLAEEQELRRRIAALEAQRLDAVAGAAGAASERTLRELLLAHDVVRARIRGDSPVYASLTEPRPLDADAVQRQVVDDGTLLLVYDLGEERSYLWALTPHSVSSHVLPPRREVEALARRAHELLTASRQREVRGPLASTLDRLSTMLLGPVADELGGRRLLVVGEGALLYVPFAALPRPAAAGAADSATDHAANGGGTREPLVAAHAVVAMPSASALAVLRSRLAARSPSALPATVTAAVLADPVFEPSDARLGGAPTPTDDARTHAGSDAARGGLRRLLYSRREAEALTALLPAGASFAALGFAARREVATGGALGRYRILHFATHGELNDEHPELSRLVLSRFDAEGRPRNGMLYAHDVYDLDLDADLVVLSACRTALGKEVRGEGLVGLTQAFLYAGAGRVLVSLWQVDDEATAELMARFYRALLRDGEEPAAALRSAQLAVRRQPRWRAPYYWAGFVLQGEWRRPPWAEPRPGTADSRAAGSH